MDLFLTNTQLLASEDINWWSGVVWIIVMFLSAVWTLILTAPIHCRASIGEQVMESFQQIFIFWWTIPLTGHDNYQTNISQLIEIGQSNLFYTCMLSESRFMIC